MENKRRLIDADELKRHAIAYATASKRTYITVQELCKAINRSETVDAVEAEEYEAVVYKLECLLCHATGNRYSKAGYSLEDMERMVTDYIEELCTEAEENAVALPCKIGDSVWAIRNFRGKEHPQKGIVSEMFFTPEMKLLIVVSHISRGEWGKTVFATCEEAEAALDRMKGE